MDQDNAIDAADYLDREGASGSLLWRRSNPVDAGFQCADDGLALLLHVRSGMEGSRREAGLNSESPTRRVGEAGR